MRIIICELYIVTAEKDSDQSLVLVTTTTYEVTSIVALHSSVVPLDS